MNKTMIYKSISMFMLLMIVLIQPLSATQTLGELEKEIDQIKQDTADKLAKQEEIEAAKVDTQTDIADVGAEIDQIKSNITSKQAEISSKQAEITTQNGKIEEIQAEIPEVKADADEMLVVLQKVTNGNVMIELVLSPDENNDDNILRRMESINTLSEFAGDTILELVEIEKELQYEKTVLEKDEAELESSKADMETEEQTLAAKEEELQEVLKNQSEASSEIDDSVERAAEDQAMLEDTLAYYESYGCTADDLVGSDCGGLGDDDSDGVINDEDSCPNEYGTKADGCPVPETDDGGSTGGGSSGGGDSSGGGSSGGGNSNATSFIRPLSSGVVTCNWGCYGGHTGMDMDKADYAPILATANGTVISAKSGCAPFYDGVNTCNGGYGNYVMLMHKTSSGVVFSLYGHMSSLSVSQGQTVSQGQQLGLLGDSGNSAGSHLHFEVFADSNGNGLPDDYKGDPRNYVSFPALGVWW